jgi:hypothetical protein
MAEYNLPKVNLAGKARAKRPGSDIEKGQSIRNVLNSYSALSIAQVRTRSDVHEIIRTLMQEEGLFSSAANAMVALSAGSGYKIAGYRDDGTMDASVMGAAYDIVDGFDTTHDYTDGFNDKHSLQSLISTAMLDVISSGGCGAELVLDKEFGPNRLVPVAYSSITWESDGKGGRYPTQDGGDIKLDLPTVFIAEHNRHADDAYAVSMMRSGIAQTFNYNEFLEDTHRAVNRTGHSRQITTIDYEAVRQMAPPEVQNDPEKMAEFFNAVKSRIEEALRDLEPEDALVSYNSVTHKLEDMGGSKADYSALLTTLGNLLGVSLKTPASVSGLRASGTQALSNAETLIYLKIVESTHPVIEDIISRALTLAVRLIGVDGFVRFKMNPVNLRPEEELEAYKTTKQRRVLELLSYGLINDAEAYFELGIRPQGAVAELAGTNFYGKNTNPVEEGERTSSAGRSLNPDTPSTSGGDDK